MADRQVPLAEIVEFHPAPIAPSSLGDLAVDLYSIPAFDSTKAPERVIASEIGSSKFSVPSDGVLLSRLNPRIPRVWLPQVDNSVVALASTEFMVLRPKQGVNRSFLRFLLSAPEFLQQIQSRVTGTSGSHQRVRPHDVLSIIVSVPPLAEQERIANTLSCFDNKTELNRRMNETLEAMARAIFRSWFVDFDPVRAKAEGRKPEGMDAETAALFPDSFVDSALGKIPKGWEVGVLGDIAENRREIIDPSGVPGDTPYIGLEHMPRRSIALGEWATAGGVESSKSRFCRGDILFGKLRPYFHKVGVAPVDGVCSTDILVIVPKSPECFGFLLFHVSSVDFVNYTDGTSTGTKMPRTNWRDMANYKIALPPVNVVAAFSRASAPMIESAISNTLQSRSLASVRDAFLPKLLSGEVFLADENCLPKEGG